MKNWIYILIILFILTACTPSEAQIQAAIEQTQTAQPTITNTPEPTKTPTIEPTPTPEFLYIKNLTYVQMYSLFSDSYFKCDNRVFYDDGSYETECNFNYFNKFLYGSIEGWSEDTVCSVGCSMIGWAENWSIAAIEEQFLLLVSFSDQREEMSEWIVVNIPQIYYSDFDDDKQVQKEFLDAELFLFGGDSNVTLLILGNN